MNEGQSSQTVIAAKGANFPATQSLQLAVPSTALILPTLHAGQEPAPFVPIEPVYPALHLQAEPVVTLVSVDHELDGHAVQDSAPEEAAKYPAWQSSHTVFPVDSEYFPL